MIWDIFRFQEFGGATWLYLSVLLAIAIFFRFVRFWSLRNWDIITLFLVVPGLLATNHVERLIKQTTRPAHLAGDVASGRLDESAAEEQSAVELLAAHPDWQGTNQFGYTWLFAISVYYVVRCLIDLLLPRRSRAEQNLNVAGITFLSVCLLSYLMIIVLTREPETAGRTGARVARSLLQGETRIPQYLGADPATVLLMMPPAAVHQGLAKTGMEGEAVRDEEFENTVVRSAVILGHLLIIAGLVMIGWQHFQSISSGLSMALLYLLLPATYVHAVKLDHLIPGVLLTWAIYFYRWPTMAGAFMGLASVSFFPLFLIPLWTGYYWGRGAVRFILSLLAITVALWLVVYLVPPLLSFFELWSTSLGSKVIISAENAPKTIGYWTESTQIYRLPIAIVFALLVIGSAFIPRKKTLADLVALSAVIVLSVQFWYADRGGTYVQWYLPLLLMLFFRPAMNGATAKTLPPAL